MAYFDDPDNYAWWQSELEILRAERERRMNAMRKESAAEIFEAPTAGAAIPQVPSPQPGEPEYEPPFIVEFIIAEEYESPHAGGIDAPVYESPFIPELIIAYESLTVNINREVPKWTA